MATRSRAKWWADVPVENPGRLTPGGRRFVALLAPLVRALHRPSLQGVEHLPASGPYLLVANHSAGLGLAEIQSVAVKWVDHFGNDRPLAGFALSIDFHVWPLSEAVKAIGAIPSSAASARRTLDAGVPILMFPGGDHEALQPVHRAGHVDFGGRLGFLRIARDAGVPIVPLGIRGGAFTAPVLLRARWLSPFLLQPRLLGVKRWGISLLGVLVAAWIAMGTHLSWPVRAALVWFWLGTPWVFMPWIPWTLRLRIGPPLDAATLFPTGEGDDELRAALARVESAVQEQVDGR